MINTAGFVRVDDAEHEPRQWRENVIGPTILARACARYDIRLLSFSSDLVFDGGKPTPYVESDQPRPLNAYGRSKLEAERRILKLAPSALVVRTAAFFGPGDRHNFVAQAMQALQRGQRWQAANDQLVSPTYVPDLAQAALNLLIDGERGLWHLTNHGAVSWAGFAQMVAEAAGLNVALSTQRRCHVRSNRFASSLLSTSKRAWSTLGSLHEAVEQYRADVELAPREESELSLGAVNDIMFTAAAESKTEHHAFP